QDNKTIGVRGRDPERAVASFRELRQFYEERLDPSPGLATHYVEFEGRGWAKSKANPTEVLSRFWADYTRLQDLGRVLETDVANFGLHLVPPNRDPNGPNWFHITVEPLIASSSTRYAVRWVWRESDTERLLDKFSRVEETLRKLLIKLEGR
ncbi:MAG: hypothetical protein Q8P59_01050, partial [Dehalococcoidia bacterium]|nr:hypothetical protein [Dehalococcoidia bacterium]